MTHCAFNVFDIIGGRFRLGRVFITPGARAALIDDQIAAMLIRHMRCDWGATCAEDRLVLDAVVASGSGMLLSAYPIDPRLGCEGYGTNTVWIQTYLNCEGVEQATTVLLPDEY